jgi:hypothetical protein
MKVLGVDYRLCSLNLTREMIEEANPSTLKRYIDLSDMELGLARDKGLETFIYGIENVLRELRAQRRVNDNRASLEHGCICG